MLCAERLSGDCSRVSQLKWVMTKKEQIRILCDQVSAYHKLEEYYKAELSKLNNKSEKTIMEEMRSKVQEIESFERPTMTANQANKIKTKYS